MCVFAEQISLADNNCLIFIRSQPGTCDGCSPRSVLFHIAGDSRFGTSEPGRRLVSQRLRRLRYVSSWRFTQDDDSKLEIKSYFELAMYSKNTVICQGYSPAITI